MMTTFGNGENAKSVMVRYLVINVASPYDVIVGRPSFNDLEAVLSTLYLTLKYPLKDGRVGIIKGDQRIARICYKDSMKLKKSHADESVKDDQVKVNLVDIDPNEDLVEDGLTPIEDVKTLKISAQSSQTTQVDSSLSPEEEAKIIRILRENMDMSKPADMPDIEPNIVCHHLALDPIIKPVAQRKWKEGEEKRRVVEGEVRKIMKVDLLRISGTKLS